MQKLTFGACLANSWRSTLEVVTRLKWLFWGMVALCFTFNIFAPVWHPGHVRSFHEAMVASLHIALVLLVMPVLYIKVCRYIVLDEGASPLMPRFGAPYGRYILLSFIYLLSVGIAGFIFGVLFGRSQTHTALGLAFAITFAFVYVRWGLLHVATSLGQRLKFGAAWRDTRGHFWSMTAAACVSQFPVVVLLVAVTLAAETIARAVGAGRAFIPVVEGVFLPLFVVQGASIWTWLYRRYANELAVLTSERVYQRDFVMRKEAAKQIPIMGKSAPAGAKLSMVLIAFVLCDTIYKFHSLFPFVVEKSFGGSGTQKTGSIVIIAFLGGFLLINVCIFLGLAFRKNWARIVGLLLAIFWIVNIALMALANGSLLHGMGAQSIAYLIAIALVFLPTTGTWFKLGGASSDGG